MAGNSATRNDTRKSVSSETGTPDVVETLSAMRLARPSHGDRMLPVWL